jgi:hypothetical protein
MRREFTYLNRLIVIEEPDEQGPPDPGGHRDAPPPAPAAGGHDHAGPQPGDDHGHGHGGHGPVVVIDGREVAVHLLSSGFYHAHEFPFMRFATLDDLAKALVNYLEYGTHHGHPEEPE